MTAPEFTKALQDVTSGWSALLPPVRMSVPEAAAEFFNIRRPGGGSGLYSPAETPYMLGPARALTDRRYKGVCFVGPSQSGKTVLLGEGWLTHAVLCDPGDFMVVQMTQEKAREYSKQRIDRMIRNGKELLAMLGTSARDDNLHDKQFKNGMWLRIAWPTATNLASTSYRYVFGTDYDRWPDNIDGEGDGWTMMLARIRTFMSRGKAAVESSPGRDVKLPDWEPATPHEAPPVGGILGIYNTSDRQRLYWKCPHCAEHFEAEPGLRLFRLDPDEELLENIRTLNIGQYARQHARVICPHNGCVIEPHERGQMNAPGLWLPEGLEIDSHDRISGTPRESNIAGFWLGGVAATYQKWDDLITSHLQALLEYELTGEETKLQSAANTGQGIPYTPRFLLEGARKAGSARKPVNDLPQHVVPDWTRLVVTAVDVQGGAFPRFIVQSHAVGVDKQQALIDRYAITMSKRLDTVTGEPLPINPATHPEDWDVLTERTAHSTYRLRGGEREIRVHRIIVDTGGEDGVTHNAYAWFRRLRSAGLAQRVVLSKGEHKTKGWDQLYKRTQVGAMQGYGDVPLMLLNANRYKDQVDHALKRFDPGPGFYYFPVPKGPKNPDGWLAMSVLEELKAEVRLDNGMWEQRAKRNETFDLCYMILALLDMLGCNRREFWQDPPSWALPLDDGNENVIAPEQRRQEKTEVAQRVRSFRRATPSPSLG